MDISELSRAKRLILGEPISSQHAAHQRLPKWKALATLSSDALSSVAYATEAILLVLLGFSAAAAIWSIPIALGIAALLIILTVSYRQTIRSYPSGGGAYIVAKDNLGQMAGLIAGASLLIDYILTVSVSVTSGVENIASAFPGLNDHKELFCGAVILVIMTMNLRGIKESSTVFAFPTYFFVFSVFAMIIGGFYKIAIGATPTPPQPILGTAYAVVPMILILRAFAAGCTALTGVEAISNGIQVFRQPAQENAKTTLIWMSIILGAMFLGITALAHMLKIVPSETETLISLLNRTVFGHGMIYYAIQAGTALILFLAANTSYADFPRLASLLARDRFLPRQFASIGDRLVFSNGIVGLSALAMLMVVLFHADTQHLLPLYAVGVFLSFTLSQAGMVVHHLREREPKWRRSMVINGLGAVTTLIVLLDICYARFIYGAWMVVASIPVFVFIFEKIHAHYLAVGLELSLADKTPPIRFQKIKHTVIVPISGIHQGVIEALQYALSISNDVRACYVEIDSERTDSVKREWERWVPGVPFVVLKSPYRSVVQPLIKYIDDVEEISHDDVVTIVVPEFVTNRWWSRLLHNQTALFIRAALAFRRRKVVTSVRYHLTKS
jgi:amino acid transporter